MILHAIKSPARSSSAHYKHSTAGDTQDGEHAAKTRRLYNTVLSVPGLYRYICRRSSTRSLAPDRRLYRDRAGEDKAGHVHAPLRSSQPKKLVASPLSAVPGCAERRNHLVIRGDCAGVRAHETAASPCTANHRLIPRHLAGAITQVNVDNADESILLPKDALLASLTETHCTKGQHTITRTSWNADRDAQKYRKKAGIRITIETKTTWSGSPAR